MAPLPSCVTAPLLELDVASAGVSCIIWATGFAVDYSWLQVDAFDAKASRTTAAACQRTQASNSWGLPWLSRTGSSSIWGVWHDARYLADHIAPQRSYLAYRPAGSTPAPINVPA